MLWTRWVSALQRRARASDPRQSIRRAASQSPLHAGGGLHEGAILWGFFCRVVAFEARVRRDLCPRVPRATYWMELKH